MKRPLISPQIEKSKSVKKEPSWNWVYTTIALGLGTIEPSKIVACMNLGSSKNLQLATIKKNEE